MVVKSTPVHDPDGPPSNGAPSVWLTPLRVVFSPMAVFRMSIMIVGVLFVVRTMAIVVEGIVDLVFVLSDEVYALDVTDAMVVVQRWGRIWTSIWMLIVVAPRLLELHQQSGLVADKIGTAMDANYHMHRRPVVVLLLLFVGGVVTSSIWQSFPNTWSHALPVLQMVLDTAESLSSLLSLSPGAAVSSSSSASLPSITTTFAAVLQGLGGFVRDVVLDLPLFISSNMGTISTWITLLLKFALLMMMLLCVCFSADHILENPINQDLPGLLAPTWSAMLNSLWRIFPPFRAPRESRERFGDLFWSNLCLMLIIMPDVVPSNTLPVWIFLFVYLVVTTLVQRLARPTRVVLRQLSTFSIYLLHFALAAYTTYPIVPDDGSCGVHCDRARSDRVDILEDLTNRCARMATQNLLHVTLLTLLGWHMNATDTAAFNPHVTSHLVYGLKQILRAPFVLTHRLAASVLRSVMPSSVGTAIATSTTSFLSASLVISSGHRSRQTAVRNLSLHVGVIVMMALITLTAYQLHSNHEISAKSDVLVWLNETAQLSPDHHQHDDPDRDHHYHHGMRVLDLDRRGAQSLLPACQFVFNSHHNETTMSTSTLRIHHLSVVADVVYGDTVSVPHAVEKLEHLTGLRFQESLLDGLINVWQQQGATVVAFRGTSSGGDVLTDVRIFMASVGLHFVLQSLPFLLPWRLVLTDDLIASLNLFLLRNQLVGVGVLNSILGDLNTEEDASDPSSSTATSTPRDIFRKDASEKLFHKFNSVAKEILRFIPSNAKSHKVFLVGHSLGGAIGQVIAHFLAEQLAHRAQVAVVPVAFNSPGIVWSQRSFGVAHDSLLQRAVNINAAQDIVSSLDPPQANVQTLKCNDGPLLCHSMHRINCILWRECGDLEPSVCDVFLHDEVASASSSSSSTSASVDQEPNRKVYFFLRVRWILNGLLPAIVVVASVLTQPLRVLSRRRLVPVRSMSFDRGRGTPPLFAAAEAL